MTLEGKQLLSIRIPRAPRRLLPVFIHGNPLSGTFKRMHDGDHHCSEDEVRRMMAEASDTGRDARVLEHFGWDDLDLDTLNGYQTVFRNQKPGHPFANLGQEEFLVAICGWGTDRERGTDGLTVAGLLMFGKWRSIVEEFPEYVLGYRDLPVDTRETRFLDRLVGLGSKL